MEERRPTVVTIGNFDGVHLGHRALIETAIQAAHQCGGDSALLTFDPHPQEVLGGRSVARIYLKDQQRRLLHQTGLDQVEVIPFTREFSGISPEEFVRHFLVEKFQLRQVVIGYDFRFGRERGGDFRLLEELGKKFHFSVQEVPPLQIAGCTVSSTLIRRLLQEHAYDQIPMYLGRGYGLSGRIVQGDQRGRLLGFPTANILADTVLAIPDGVYATRVCWRGNTYYGVTNVGKRPTFQRETSTIETHIFDLQSELYGEEIEVQPLKYLREVRDFGSKEALQEQIARDVAAAQEFFAPRRQVLGSDR